MRKYEGLRLVAYVCPAGVLTIGYGHTGKDVTQGLRITEERAEALLMADLGIAQRAVQRLVKVPLTPHQEAALIDFVFNLGAGSLETSTLLRKLNDGDYRAVPAQLKRWDKARVKGVMQPLRGLTLRRADAITLWNT